MAQNPGYYPDSEVFRPERHLREKHQDSSLLDPLEIVFGFGRRLSDSFLDIFYILIIYQSLSRPTAR